MVQSPKLSLLRGALRVLTSGSVESTAELLRTWNSVAEAMRRQTWTELAEVELSMVCDVLGTISDMVSECTSGSEQGAMLLTCLKDMLAMVGHARFPLEQFFERFEPKYLHVLALLVSLDPKAVAMEITQHAFTRFRELASLPACLSSSRDRGVALTVLLKLLSELGGGACLQDAFTNLLRDLIQAAACIQEEFCQRPGVGLLTLICRVSPSSSALVAVEYSTELKSLILKQSDAQLLLESLVLVQTICKSPASAVTMRAESFVDMLFDILDGQHAGNNVLILTTQTLLLLLTTAPAFEGGASSLHLPQHNGYHLRVTSSVVMRAVASLCKPLLAEAMRLMLAVTRNSLLHADRSAILQTCIAALEIFAAHCSDVELVTNVFLQCTSKAVGATSVDCKLQLRSLQSLRSLCNNTVRRRALG